MDVNVNPMSRTQEIAHLNIDELVTKWNVNDHKPLDGTGIKKHHFFISPLQDIVSQFNDYTSAFMTDFYSIYYVKEGRFEKMNQLEGIVLEDGEMFFSKPGDIKKWSFTNDVKGYFVAFTKEYLLTLIENKNFLNSFDCLIVNLQEKFELDMRENHFFNNAFSEIINENSNPTRHSQISIKLWLSVLLIKINRICKNEDDTANEIDFNTSADHIYHKFITALEENFTKLAHRECMKPYTVAEFAKRLNVNPSYLNECVKKASSKNAKSLINERWLLMAKCQLMHTGKNVSEIAYQLGFESPGYFARFFKKFESMSPVEFRRLSNMY